MNLKQALYVKTIAQTGNISKAAKLLYISQPSLSYMLKQAEEEAGLQFFDRSKSPLELTYAGERYLHAAELILSANEQLERELDSIKKEDSGRLRLGISVSRAIQILPHVIPRFIEMYPNVKLELTESGSETLNEKLRRDELDLAMSTIVYNEPDFSYELLENETIGILAGKGSPLWKKKKDGDKITVKDLEGNRFYCLNRGHSSRVTQDLLFAKYDFKPDVILEMNSIDLARLLTLQSGACMVLPSIYRNSVIELMEGKYFELEDCQVQRTYYASYKKERYMSGYTRDFINLVREYFASVKES